MRTIFSAELAEFKELAQKTQLINDCVPKIIIFANFECLKFLFLPLKLNNFWTAEPIFVRKEPFDLSEKTLYFGHQFFEFILKNVWVMA